MSRNRDLWLERGIGPEAHARCDEALPLFMEAVRLAGPGLASRVFEEARFQVEQVPRLTAHAQRKFSWREARKIRTK